MNDCGGGVARGGCGLIGLAFLLLSGGTVGCVYDWPKSILPHDGGNGDGGWICGNGLLEPGESCDGTDFGGETCGTQGFGAGWLSCGPGCQLDTSNCRTGAVCGDGWVGEGEECDDGGLEGGDGCDSACTVEPGWVCTGEPSSCTDGCGNGLCYSPAGETSSSCPEDCGWAHLAAGSFHSCGVTGDGALFCWGDNSMGQLGDGSGEDHSAPTRVEGLPPVAVVAAGIAHTCALTRERTVYCWGDNSEGQLGDGSIMARPLPALVASFGDVVTLSAGALHTCATTEAREAYCWGRNAEGQLGDGELLGRQEPTPVVVGAGLTAARDVACGGSHSCAIHEDDTVWCWGSNASGQLGTGNTEDSLLPRAVDEAGGFTHARLISAGEEHTCAVDVQGALWCWGNGGQRRLGDGAAQSRTSPVSVITVGSALEVASGGKHTCALSAEGGYYCWGAGTEGQLGTVSTPPQSNPVSVPNVVDGWHVVAGSLHTCALLEDRHAYCWGDGLEGQLGQGVPTGSATAVPVSDPY